MDGRVSDGRNGWCRGARRSARRRRSQALGSKPPWKGSSRRSAREQSAGARSLHAARQRPGPNPWHPPRMPCSSASPPRPPAGQPAAKKHLVEGGFSEGKRGLCARSKRKAHVSRREAFCDGSNAHLVWSAQCRRPGSGKLGRKVAHDAPSDAGAQCEITEAVLSQKTKYITRVHLSQGRRLRSGRSTPMTGLDA